MNVHEMQTQLNQLGHNPGRIDGLWGPRTEAAAKALLGPHAARARDIWLATEQMIYRRRGIPVGPIDGIMGPITRRARRKWAAGTWRNALHENPPAPSGPANKWPTYANIASVFGPPGTNQTLVAVPYPLRLSWNNQAVHRVGCHRLIAEPTVRVLQKTLNHYGRVGVRELELDVWGGCFNNRSMRGGTRLSTHAWGIAHDFNPQKNGLRVPAPRAQFSAAIYNKWWEFWEEEGATSLGRARNFDWMHVQFAGL